MTYLWHGANGPRAQVGEVTRKCSKEMFPEVREVRGKEIVKETVAMAV